MIDRTKQVFEQLQAVANKNGISIEEMLSDIHNECQSKTEATDIEEFFKEQFNQSNGDSCRKSSKIENLQAELTKLKTKYGRDKEN